MNIVMFSITPLFPHHDMGGAQKHLRAIALYLAELGHEITILCTRREDTPQPFHWHERIVVKPILRFKQPFPGPYDTGAVNLASVIQEVGEHLQNADRFYMHDGEFLFPQVYRHVPTVVSLRDNVYPETIQGGFQFQAHTLVLISEFSRQFYLHTAGRFLPDLPSRMKVIHNGIQWERFKQTPPSERLLQHIGGDPRPHKIILHPHRPEENKGMWQTIEVVDLLVNHHHITDIRVLVPRWLGLQFDEGVSRFYQRVDAELAKRGLTPYFVFHEWVPVDLLPEYYSLGDVMFSLGSFVESFGNAVYEALGCGTRVVTARISTHRELLPPEMIDGVDFNDHAEASRKTAHILQSGLRTDPAVIAYLQAHYGVQRQWSAYAETILGASLVEPLRYQLEPIHAETQFQLAPWCYRTENGAIYHDFRADYAHSETLERLLSQYAGIFSLTQAQADGVASVQVQDWLREGYIVPITQAVRSAFAQGG